VPFDTGLTIIGFLLTVWTLIKTRRAADAAASAAKQVRDAISSFDAASECGVAIEGLEQLKNEHRNANVLLLPMKYAALRKSLTTIRQLAIGLDAEQQLLLQKAVTELAAFEDGVERALKQNTSIDAQRLNKIVVRQVGDLTTLRIHLRHKATRREST
jgi:hypothetical protein